MKFFQRWTKHHDMKTSGEMGVQGQAFSTLISDEVYASAALPPVIFPCLLDRKLRGFQSLSGDWRKLLSSKVELSLDSSVVLPPAGRQSQ